MTIKALFRKEDIKGQMIINLVDEYRKINGFDFDYTFFKHLIIHFNFSGEKSLFANIFYMFGWKDVDVNNIDTFSMWKTMRKISLNANSLDSQLIKMYKEFYHQDCTFIIKAFIVRTVRPLNEDDAVDNIIFQFIDAVRNSLGADYDFKFFNRLKDILKISSQDLVDLNIAEWKISEDENTYSYDYLFYLNQPSNFPRQKPYALRVDYTPFNGIFEGIKEQKSADKNSTGYKVYFNPTEDENDNKEISDEQKEKIYREQLRKYRVLDAKKHTADYLESITIDYDIVLSEDDYECMTDQYEDEVDCNIAENDIWDRIVKQYIDDIIENIENQKEIKAQEKYNENLNVSSADSETETEDDLLTKVSEEEKEVAQNNFKKDLSINLVKELSKDVISLIANGDMTSVSAVRNEDNVITQIIFNFR